MVEVVGISGDIGGDDGSGVMVVMMVGWLWY